jgi:hypothetical protein
VKKKHNNDLPVSRDNPFGETLADVLATGTGVVFLDAQGNVVNVGAQVMAVRNEMPVPKDFRVAQYPDGSRRVQAAYQWQEGSNWGITWRDLPLVQVDAQGKELM